MQPANYSPPVGGKPKKKKQFPFGLLMLCFGAILGAWGGISVTQRAAAGPEWARKLFHMPQREIVIAPAPPLIVKPEVKIDPPLAPVAEIPQNPKEKNLKIEPTADEEPNETAVKTTSPTKKAEMKDIIATWEISDKLTANGSTGTVTSAYAFHEDETGEFSSNGRKLYDFRWVKKGEDILLQYDGDAPDGSSSWEVKLTWSLNDDHSLLTLIPHGGKDARALLYGSGPGVYRKKG